MVPRAPDRKGASPAADLGRYAGLGFQFAFTLALFGAAGWWLDEKLGTRPWLLIAGIFLGAVLAFIALLWAVPTSNSKAAKGSRTIEGSANAPRSPRDKRPPEP